MVRSRGDFPGADINGGHVRTPRRAREAHARPALAPSLAESWQVSRDGLAYEFTLRSGVLFHNGERVMADDVKFSFDRYRGSSAKLLKDRVAAVEVVDPLHIRFRLKAPWPDFMVAYATRSEERRVGREGDLRRSAVP